ncbi:MAG: LamG domain-containing protein [Verrucomicrobiales bacterium]|nr:LamG domain-containing protein [Verrucomicrobiales bacterium]
MGATFLAINQGQAFNNQLHPSGTDAWDVSTGAIVSSSTDVGSGSDPQDIFGGTFSSSEPGTVLFADGKPAGYIHAIEWQTTSPIDLQSIRLFAKGDGSANNNAREFASFVLKTKSSPTSGFDIQILSYTPSHPYVFTDAATFALQSVNVTPTTRQFFRAEFVQFGDSAPRIIELDGFEEPLTFSCVPPPLGIVAFWNGDLTADDLVNGLNGTGVGSLFYDQGKVGPSFGFDGNGEVEVPNNSKLNVQTFSFEAWVYPTALDGGNDMIVCKEDSSGVQYEVSIKGPVVQYPNAIPVGNLAFYIGGIQGPPSDYAGWVNGGGAVPLSQWSHIALTFDGTMAKTYINGVEARSVTGLSGQVTVTSGSLKIGSRRSDLLAANPNERFNGLIDEVSLYNRALTAAEIDSIYSADSAGKCASTVEGRFVFYNNSKFDGNNAAASDLDDDAIPSNKAVLLPVGTATFSNYSSYSRGINGLMVDVAYVGSETLSNDDFIFRVGNDNIPSGWTAAPAPNSITVRMGAGLSGSDRITLIWTDDAIKKQWLQVTVKSTSNTALLKDDVFYFGNAVGDAGNNAADAKVNATDEILARNNPRSNGQAPITFAYDYNRDSKVNATDEIIARNNSTSSVTALKLISVP